MNKKVFSVIIFGVMVLALSIPFSPAKALVSASVQAQIDAIRAQIIILQQLLLEMQQAENVAKVSSVRVIAPNGGDLFILGKTTTVTWAVENMNDTDTIKLSLINYKAFPEKVTSFGSSFKKDIKRYQWTVPASIGEGAVFKVKADLVRAGKVIATDYSDNYFTILPVPGKPSITVTSPLVGETWRVGSTYTISWTYYGMPSSDMVAIELIGPTSKFSMGTAPAGNGSFSWKVPQSIGFPYVAGASKYRIGVSYGIDTKATSAYFGIAVNP